MKLFTKLIWTTLLVLALSIGVLGLYLVAQKLKSPNPAGIDTKDLSSWSQNGINWYQDQNHSYVLATFNKPLWLNFQASNPVSIDEVAEQNSLGLVINGGYFQRLVEGFAHSGLLIIDGQLRYGLVQDKQNQVTDVVIDNAQTMSIKSSTEVVGQLETLTKPGVNALQTGPVIMLDNTVQDAAINRSLNGSGKYVRSVIGYALDQNGELTKFVFMSKVQLTLHEVAELLVNLEPFAGQKISAVNLDGGSSTAIYSANPEFSFGTLKRLPALIGVR